MKTGTGKSPGLPTPPLSEWLFRTYSCMHRKGLLEQASGKLHLSVPTLRNGGPKHAKAQALLMRRILDGVERRASWNDDDIARAFLSRTQQRVQNGLMNNYWFSFGDHEDSVVRDIAAAVDNFDTALFYQTKTMAEIDETLCRAAADPAVVPRPAILSPAPQHLPVNVKLLMLAALDHAFRHRWQPKDRQDDRPYAIVLCMAPRSIDGTFRSPTRRYLDFLYPTALRFQCKRRQCRFSMPSMPATISELEHALHLQQPEGKRSRIIYWRSGEKKLYWPELEAMLRTVFGEAADEARELFAYPYWFAMFWECLRSYAPEQVDWAIQRYIEWWTVLSKEDPTLGAARNEYWERV